MPQQPTFYQSPGNPGRPGAADYRSLFTALAFFASANFLITEWLAIQLTGPGRGAPWVSFFGLPLYAPWHWAVWAFTGWLRTPDARPLFGYAVLAAGASVLVSALLKGALVSLRQRGFLTGKEHLHGSAKWATEEDVRKTGRLTAEDGPFIGGWESKPGHIQYLRDPFDDNVLAVAPPGSGKTSGLVLPTLLSNEKWSMFVLDPKEQLYELSSGYRSAAGCKVFKFAPGTLDSAHYNPLAEIRLFTPYDVKDASQIAHLICHVPGEPTSDAHWDQVAERFMIGVILHCAYKAHQESRVATLLEVAEAINPSTDTNIQESTLPEMAAYAHDPTGKGNWKTATGYDTKVHPVVRAAANAMFERIYDGEPNREFEGVVANCAKRLDIYRDPLISAATASSDWSAEDLVNHSDPVTIYLCIPFGDADRLLPITRLVVTMHVIRLTESVPAARLYKHRILWMLDEFPTLRDLPAIADSLAGARDFGMKFFLICQTFAQIDLAYRKAPIIINNCDVWIAYAPNDLDTRKMLSQQAGKRTVAHRVQTFAGGRYASGKNSINESVSASERELITPDEVGRLRNPVKGGPKMDRIIEPGDMLIYLRGCSPIFGRQMLYFFDKELLHRSQIAPITQWSPI